MEAKKLSNQTQKKGNTPKTTTQKPPLKIEEKPQNAKAQPEQTKQEQAPKKQLTVAERLVKLEGFKLLANKHEQIQAKCSKMERFTISSTGTDDVLTIRSSSGEDFNTGSETVIKDVLTVINNHLQSAKTKVEQEIENFEI